MKNSEFVATLGIPIFDEEDPFAALLILESTLQFQLTKNIRTARNKLKIHLVDMPPSVEVILGIIVSFDNNPDIEFRVLGQFFASGTIVLAGEMIGMWENAFGISGFNIGNAAISVGFSPTFVSIGIGCQLDIGSKTIVFHGRVAFPDLTNVFLLASLKANDGSGIAISFREIGEFWNYLMPKGIMQLDTESIPEDWGLLDTSFYLSGRGGRLLGKKYPPGFSFDSGIKVFGIKLKMHMSVHWVKLGFATIPNFAFDFYLNLEEFYPLVEAKLRSVTPGALQDPSDLSPAAWWKVLLLHAFDFSTNFFKLNEVALLGLDFRRLAMGGTVLLRVDFDFWGINTVFEIRLSMADLYRKTIGAVLDVFRTLRKTLFSLPDCLFDGDCWRDEAEDPNCKCELYEIDEGYCEREGAPERCPSGNKKCKNCFVSYLFSFSSSSRGMTDIFSFTTTYTGRLLVVSLLLLRQGYA